MGLFYPSNRPLCHILVEEGGGMSEDEGIEPGKQVFDGPQWFLGE
jgi:hypothetical protein